MTMTARRPTRRLRIQQRIGMLGSPRRYADDNTATRWIDLRQRIREHRHRNAVLTRRQSTTTSAPAGDTFVGWRARWLGNRDIGLPSGAEGTVTDLTPAGDNGRRCYRIAFDNEGPVIYTYLPAPWDLELIPTGQ